MGIAELAILIVEDDAIIGQSIRSCLRKAGYGVMDTVNTGRDALTAVLQQVPDLILMDIALDGEWDGITTAQYIREKHDVPIVYLTAYADEETLSRAKTTDPYGYVLKPFEERLLLVTLEMAFNKHELQKCLRQSEEQYRLLVENQSEGVTIVDMDEKFIFTNPAADLMFGVEPGELLGRTITEFTSPDQYEIIRHQSNLRKEGFKGEYEFSIVKPDGSHRFIAITAAPWLDADGKYVGSLGILRDVTEKKLAEQAEYEQRILADALRDSANLLSSTLDINEVLDRILVIIDQVVPHDAGNITMINAEGWTHIARARGYEALGVKDLVESISFNTTETNNYNTMVLTHLPLVIPDTKKDANWKIRSGFEWLCSFVSAPIIIKGKVIGFINLDATTPGFFNEKSAKQLFAFAGQAAMAIENAQLFQETSGRAEFLELLHDITEIGLKARSLNNMLKLIVDKVADWFGADGVNLTQWDEETQQPLPGAASSAYGPEYYALRTRPGEVSLTESSLQMGTVVIVDDVFHSQYVSPDLAARFMLHSFLVFPLIADGKKLGAMLIGYYDHHKFTDDQIFHGYQIAAQVALVIAKGQSVEAEQQRRTQLERANSLITALSHIATRIETASPMDRELETLGEELEELRLMSMLILKKPGSQKFSINFPSPTLNDPERMKMLGDLSLEDIDHEILQSGEIPVIEPITEPRFNANALLLANKILEKFQPDQVKVICDYALITPSTHGIILPLTISDEIIGSMWLWGEELLEADIPALIIFASQVAITIENSRLYREVHHLAMTDELTGLFNRRRLFEIAQMMILDAFQDHKNFSLIIIDTDEFKKINDTYGHLVGDEIICNIASRCSHNARKSDSIGRYGGDEFILLFPNSDMTNTIRVAERIRQDICSTPILTSAGPIPVTISLGVASIQSDEDTLISLLIRADKALYRAKQEGRNLVITAKSSKEGTFFEIHRPVV